MAGKMVGEFPGLQKGLDTDGNVAAASDFRGVYSAHRVRAGRVIVELVNRGQDTHDLDLRRSGSQRIIRLWCAIADHREHGMHAVLHVVRRK